MSATLFVATFALSLVSSAYIELPIRRRVVFPTRHRLGTALAFSVAALLSVGATIAGTQGWPGRLKPEVWSMLEAAEKPLDRKCHFGATKRLGELCVLGADGATPDFALVGDSHADAMAPAVASAATTVNRSGFQLTDAGYRPAMGFRRIGEDEKRIKTLDAMVLELLSKKTVRDVVIVGNWTSAITARHRYFDEDGNLHTNLAALTQSFTRLVRSHPKIRFHILEDNPTGRELSPIFAAQALHLGGQSSAGMSRAAYEVQLTQARQLLAELSSLPNVKIIAIADSLCDQSRCPSTRSDKLLYRDGDHLSVFGALQLQNVFVDILKN